MGNGATAKAELPYFLLPAPYSLLPTPYSLLPTPYSLLPTPFSRFALYLSALRESSDVFPGSKRERLDRHRRLAAAAGHERRSVHDEQILHVVRSVILVHDRRLRIVAHAAGAEQVESELLALHGLLPRLERARGLEQLFAARREILADPQVLRMVLIGDAQSGNAPRVIDVGIQRHAVRRD